MTSFQNTNQFEGNEKPTYEALEKQLAEARKIMRAFEQGKTQSDFQTENHAALQHEDETRQIIKQNQIFEERIAECAGKIQIQKKRLRKLAQKLIRVEQDERKELGAILHDQIQPLVIGARMQIWEIRRKNDPITTLKVADKIESILVEILDSLRSLSSELNPSVLKYNGIVGGLNWLKNYMADKLEFTVNLFVENDIEPVHENTIYLLFESVKELLLNAAKHAGTSEANLSIRRTDNDSICIVVSDQGSGFDSKIITRALNGQSTLGLFSIQERIATIDGQMLVETTPGKGTKITLTVPAGESVDVQRSEKSGANPKPRSKAENVQVSDELIGILIVDDHKVLREGLKGLLQLEPDFHVMAEASDGDQAIKLAQELNPDVVIMDINLGNTHGIQVTQKILEKQPEICIIGLSMHSDPSIIDAMHRAGAAAYLTKDSPSDDLINAIRKFSTQ